MPKTSAVTVTDDTANSTVFSSVRNVKSPDVQGLPKLKPKLNQRLKMEGRKFLSTLPESSFPVVFFDPQHRGILDKMNYGNEGKSRGRRRCELPQMTEKVIHSFIEEINRILIPSGHLFLWLDKYHLCQGFSSWLVGTDLDIVDMITWDKQRMGMGYRTRRRGEYLVVLQELPRKAKGVWKIHNIPDIWDEEPANKNGHAHRKPVELQTKLIHAVSNEGDIIIDPAAGSFSVMDAAKKADRKFLGCDING